MSVNVHLTAAQRQATINVGQGRRYSGRGSRQVLRALETKGIIVWSEIIDRWILTVFGDSVFWAIKQGKL